MFAITPTYGLLTAVEVDGGGGENTSVFEELLYKHVLNRYLLNYWGKVPSQNVGNWKLNYDIRSFHFSNL